MKSARRPGFTLLELLIGLGISSVLIITVYFFYIGLIRTEVRSEDQIKLNQYATIQLERMVRELQLAVQFETVTTDEISFRRAQVSATEDPDGYQVNMDLTARNFDTVTYRRVEMEGNKVALQRILTMGNPEVLFVVDELDKKIFTGWVIPKGAEETPHETPDMQIFRADRDVRSDRQRIPVVKIRLKMKLGRASMDIVTKAFIPPVYSRILQPNWNQG